MPAWINSNVMTSFLIVLLPISRVGLKSYCFPISILTRQQVYTVVLAISGALSRNKIVVGANSHWSFCPDLTSWLLTLTWMAGVSYGVPMNPHESPRLLRMPQLSRYLQRFSTSITYYVLYGLSYDPRAPALPQVVLFSCNGWAEFIVFLVWRYSKIEYQAFFDLNNKCNYKYNIFHNAL